ncbi:hypothetical protein BH20ACI2_BH20ACI2_16750 [soil metagenome]
MQEKMILTLAAFSAALVLFTTGIAQQRTTTGTLTPTVEAGGWLIVDQNEKFLILNAHKFSGEAWFKTGMRVTATGEIKRDVMTIYQEGTPFEAATLVPAQNSTSTRRLTLVTVSGDARISVQPDTATVTISVVTQNPSAVEAQQSNASRTTAVLSAVKSAAGPGAEIKTSGYSLIPQRVYKQNEPPTITGYEARNSVTVTMNDLTRVGPVIDAASRAGANNIEGVSFTLREDREARGRALAESTRAAIAKANTLAQTLGGRVNRIVSVTEGGTTPRPMIYAQQETFARAAVETPIEPGTLEITAFVQLTAEIEMPS